ncbi:Hypothetical predicted protein [Podarcis lilfordi]|uniref:Uncharacterized protein n=1 Tax=Podarcis lilfordi TaxID=74358 RepID=A0AA35KAD1_9SAUR|nr:Hypothetical predicted protein [Podarcis lilfordi]
MGQEAGCEFRGVCMKGGGFLGGRWPAASERARERERERPRLRPLIPLSQHCRYAEGRRARPTRHLQGAAPPSPPRPWTLKLSDLGQVITSQPILSYCYCEDKRHNVCKALCKWKMRLN